MSLITSPSLCFYVLGLILTAHFSSAQNISQLDSLHSTTLSKIQHLRDTISQADLLHAEAMTNSINKKIDSLQALNLPTDRYRQKLDSISLHLRNKVVARPRIDSLKMGMQHGKNRVQQVQDSLSLALDKRRLSLQEKIDRRTAFLDSTTNAAGLQRINRDLPTNPLNGQLPAITNPDLKMTSKTDLPGVNDIQIGNALEKPDVNLNLPGEVDQLKDPLKKVNEKGNSIAQKPRDMIQDNEIVTKAGDIKQEINKVNDISQKVKTYSEEVKDVCENGLSRADDLTKEAEKRVTNELMKQDAMVDLQAQNGNIVKSRNMIEQYQDLLASMKDKDQVLKSAKELAAENMVDPFANQEDKLKAGIAQLDKLKKKYKTIPDSRYLPKRAPNEMKGKPFRERIVPGLGFQLFKSDRTAIDFAPYVAYKLSGRFRPGVGASWRSAVWLKNPWMQSDEVYGYRVFNGLRIYSTFYFHTEAEWLHFSDAAKARYKFPVEKDFKDWRFRGNVGILRSYTINKHLNGQFQILYNVLDLTRFPQNRNTSLRFGLEYKFLPKKIRQNS
jgi:hypothetical protein